MKTRRKFVTELLFAGMVLGGSALVGSSCSLLRRDGFSAQVQQGQVNSPPLDPISQKILHHASLAPSGHNSQPWRVRICRYHEWIIEADPARRLPCVDPDNRELLLSLGAFIENLSITAATLSLHAEVEILAEDHQDREIARVVLQEGPRRDYSLQTLGKRRTIKHGQLPRVLAASDLTRLMAEAEGQITYAARGTKQAAYIEESAVEAFRLQGRRKDAQQEFVHWLRLDNTEVMRHRDGITTDSMGLSGIAGWYVNTFLSPDDFLTEKMRQEGVDTTAALAREGGGWLLLTSRGQTVAELLACGRRFQRIALAACELGIAIHPMTQILEEKGAPSLHKVVGDDTLIPQFVLRVGYPDRYPPAASLRRPVAWFVYS
jgi:nitroreductase